jgi:N-acetylmuramoyl-L-alanine amidase
MARKRRARSGLTAATAVLLAVSALVLLLAAPAAAGSLRIAYEGERDPDEIGTLEVGGVTYLRLADVARSFGASRHWNAQVRRMTLVVEGHRVALSEGNPFARVDTTVVNLGSPSLVRSGVFWVPQAFLPRALGPSVNTDFQWDTAAGSVSARRLAPSVTSVELLDDGRGSSVIIGLSDRADFTAANTRGGVIVVHFPGATLGDTLGIEGVRGLVTSVEFEETETGVRAVVGVSDEAAVYSARLRRDPYRVEVNVESGTYSELPNPVLRKPKSLLPSAADEFEGGSSGIQTIMLDPGCGGREMGGVGASGLSAKEVSLALADELYDHLKGEGYLVFMTRTTDSYVTPRRRSEMANISGADLFVSIHVNAWYSQSAVGFQVLHYEPPPQASTPTDPTERGGLRREHSGSRSRAVDALSWNRLQERSLEESRSFARYVHANLVGALSRPDRGLRGAHLTVLGGCDMPAIQVDVGFITNDTEESLLGDRDFRSRVVTGIARGIDAYRRGSVGR